LPDVIGLVEADAIAVLTAILQQFIAEGLVELSPSSLSARNFSQPLTSPWQLKIMQLQLTNRCNLACVHCYAKSGTPFPDELPTNKLFALIDEFVSLGGCRLFLTGGEALLHPELETIVAYAKSRHLFVSLSTNGFAITKEKVAKLVKLGIGAVNVSIDGSNAATHDTFRGQPGAFAKAYETLRLFSESGVVCGSQTTIFKGNLTESESIYDAMRKLRVRSSFFVRMMPQGRGKMNNLLIPTMEEYRLAREKEYRNRRLRYGMNIYPRAKSNSSRCSAAVSQLYVRADGKCYPCPSLELEKLCLGDYKHATLAEIWEDNPKELSELRQFKPETMAGCVGCIHQSVCKGGCAGNALHVNGDWRTSDPHFCITMDIRKRLQLGL
jgi:radical SAM protein with 4Fe4S-binding SPASM domain